MSNGIVAAFALVAELPMLLLIWNWSVQRKMYLALLGASALIFIPVLASLFFKEHLPAPAYLGFGGMYIFAGLVWRWWKDGVAPERWGASELILAVIATAMFSLASRSLS